MERNKDVDVLLEHIPQTDCFSKEALYEACYEATLFVEQNNQTKKEEI
jgi:hypothetical protein